MSRTPRGPGTPRVPLRGDRSKRVTVPLPQSFHELGNIATHHFGAGSCMRMYHKGEKHLENHHHFKAVDDDHVIVIPLPTPDHGKFDGISTHMATYVKHPLEDRLLPPPFPRGLDMDSPKFTGRSCYQGDYLEHPLEAPVRAKPPAWTPMNMPMVGGSTYAEHYPWRDPSLRPSKPAAPVYAATQPPFNGMSSYKHDFIKHDMQRPQSARGQRKNEFPTAPFDGSTTYADDYKKHPHAQSRMIPLRQELGPPLPFQGHSEYEHEYIKKQKHRGPLVHLEPEIKSRK